MNPPGATMRLFVALVPPADALAELAAAVDALRSTPACAGRGPSSGTSRWRSSPRSTTAPARPCPAARAGRARHPPPTLALAGGGRFGQVLWTRVDGDRIALRRLADTVRAAARRCGLPTDPRPYRPHLTLARASRTAPDLAPLATALTASRAGRGRRPTCTSCAASLGAGPGGTAHHEPLASWPLSVDRESSSGVGCTRRSDAATLPARGPDRRVLPRYRTRRRSTGSWWSSTRSCATAATGCSSCGAPTTATGSCPAGASRSARRPPKPSSGRSSRRAASRSRSPASPGSTPIPRTSSSTRVEGARQQVAVCLHARARPAHGELPRPDDDETTAAAWFTPAETTTLAMHPDVRRRLDARPRRPDGRRTSTDERRVVDHVPPGRALSDTSDAGYGRYVAS